jgi:hypothetical protein
MTVGAINSGAINAVPFPQAEAGLSLIQLVGTVEVTGSISSLSTRRVVGATTVASAHGTADIVFQQQVGATTEPRAVVLVVNVPRVTDNTATASARAPTAAAIVLTRRNSALRTAQAVVSGKAVIKVRRSAAATAVATVSQIDAQTLVARLATTPARAITSALLTVEAFRSATTVARATSTSRIQLRHRSTAHAIASALGTALSANKLVAGATTSAVASVSAVSRRKIRFTARVVSAAASQNNLVGLNYRFGATATASANGVSGMGLKYLTNATTVAEAITSSAATDYGIRMPAPLERLMFVPTTERNMEVTE